MIPPNVLEGKPLDIEPSSSWHTRPATMKSPARYEAGLVKGRGVVRGVRWALPDITLHEKGDKTKDPARGRADRKYKFRNAMCPKLTGGSSEVCVLVHTSHPVELRNIRLLLFPISAIARGGKPLGLVAGDRRSTSRRYVNACIPARTVEMDLEEWCCSDRIQSPQRSPLHRQRSHPSGLLWPGVTCNCPA